MSEQNEIQAPEKTPMPDGVGLSLSEVQNILNTRHNISVSPDDPLLMVVTILNAFLSETDKLHLRHGKALSAIMADKTDAYVLGVQQATDSLAEQLSASSMEGISKLFAEHAEKLQNFKNAMWYASAVIAVSAIVNVAAFVLRGAAT